MKMAVMQDLNYALEKATFTQAGRLPSNVL